MALGHSADCDANRMPFVVRWVRGPSSNWTVMEIVHSRSTAPQRPTYGHLAVVLRLMSRIGNTSLVAGARGPFLIRSSKRRAAVRAISCAGS